jgi:hypothetical protein
MSRSSGTWKKGVSSGSSRKRSIDAASSSIARLASASASSMSCPAISCARARAMYAHGSRGCVMAIARWSWFVASFSA